MSTSVFCSSWHKAVQWFFLLFTMTAILAAGVQQRAFAADLPQYRRITVVPTDISVPREAALNTMVPITVGGIFNDTCYRLRYSAAGIDERAKLIRIYTEAAHFYTSWCLFVMVPFETTVHVTPQEAGTYRIYVVNEAGQEDYTGMNLSVFQP